MKATSILLRTALVTTFAAVLALPVMAQPGPGNGPGFQSGQGYGQGQGMHRGGRGMRGGQGGRGGMALLTAEERDAQRTKMRAVKTMDECKALQTEHRTTMEARAKEKGITLPTPRQNACENMKARGFIQ